MYVGRGGWGKFTDTYIFYSICPFTPISLLGHALLSYNSITSEKKWKTSISGKFFDCWIFHANCPYTINHIEIFQFPPTTFPYFRQCSSIFVEIFRDAAQQINIKSQEKLALKIIIFNTNFKKCWSVGKFTSPLPG